MKSGRFAVVADFERVEHMQLFHLTSPDGTGGISLSLDAGVPATGKRCLRCTFGEPRDVLAANNEPAADWFMKRDWRDYDLLVMQLHSAKPALEVQFSIIAGPGAGRTAADSVLRLEKGWNLVRIDLAEVGERLPLDDVAELQWSVPNASEPITLRLDDLILTHNTEALLGNPAAGTPEMYVQRRGRRWSIGAGGRFELTFAGGQIVQWFDLVGDPGRLNNLVSHTVMGPTPVVLPFRAAGRADVLDSGGFGAIGENVLSGQRIVEMSSARVVVQCQWQFAKAGEAPSADGPFQRWTYAVYPTGSVFVHVECTTAHAEWRPEELGLVVSRADYGAMDCSENPADAADPGNGPRRPSFGFTRSSVLDAPALLWVMHDPDRLPDMRCVADERARRTALVASGGAVERESDRWTCLINLWPPENANAGNAAMRALDYLGPAGRIDVDVGRWVTDDPGDDDGDGFNERLGCYVMAADDAQLRFRLDGRERPMFSPAFSVKGSAGRDAWIYVDYSVIKPSGRDVNGDLLFQLPGVVGTRSLVEVYLRARE